MHKALAPSQKVSSLYVFDALLRAAQSQVVKHGITTPPESSSGKGNAATFLSKVEGVADSLFEDMISTGNSEAKVSGLYSD
jgi:protein NRD1